MKNTLIFTFVCFIILSFYSCDKCKNLDCAASNFAGQLRIVNKTNGNDLVFGSNALYDKNKIKFYSLKGNDTIFFDYTPIKFGGNNYDSILLVRYFPQVNGLTFIKLNNTDIDTLSLSYISTNTKCCGEITNISKFVYNNSTEIDGNIGTVELKK